MRAYKALPQAAAVIAAIIVLIYVNTVPIGVADGGGQYKVLESLGLNYLSAPTADYFAVVFGIFKAPQVRDTQSAIAAFAIGDGEKNFFINKIAYIYSILFLLGLWLAVRSISRDDKINWVAAVLCLLIFADIGYTAYFNTLYIEGAVLVTFLLTASLILLCHKKKDAPIYLIILSSLSCIAFSFCGTLQALVGVILGILIARLYTISNRNLNKYISLLSGLAVIALSLVFASTYKPVDYEKNIYNAVFLGTAKYASVAELGMNPRLDELKGTFFADNIAEQYNLKQEFYPKINYMKITKFYLTHPAAFFKEINGAVKNAYIIRPSYLGNYTQQSGKAKELAGGFSLYSTLKSKFVPNTFIFTILFFVIYFAVLVYIYIKEKDKRSIAEVLIGLGIAAAASLKLPIIFSGEYEIGRSLFTFNIMFDAIILSVVVAGGRYMIERRQNLQSKYGASQ